LDDRHGAFPQNRDEPTVHGVRISGNAMKLACPGE
jgi:hypothetical protein